MSDKISDDWINTRALRCHNRPHYQQWHNFCPILNGSHQNEELWEVKSMNESFSRNHVSKFGGYTTRGLVIVLTVLVDVVRDNGGCEKEAGNSF